nr:MAG TPA: hypothetical protein [Caudoviricetes sp.]
MHLFSIPYIFDYLMLLKTSSFTSYNFGEPVLTLFY